MELGIKVLKFPADTIKAAMFDHKDSIQTATHALLSKWLKEQLSRQEAYLSLLEGLKNAQINQLASNLRIWVEGPGVIPQIMDERFAKGGLNPGLSHFLSLVFPNLCSFVDPIDVNLSQKS